MTRQLVGLHEHLAPLLAGLSPTAPVRLPWREALGLIAAEDVIAPAALPPTAVARRSGLAVNALDCAGASAQSPAPLPASPVRVTAGDPLPTGCDAILDPEALQGGRFGPEALEPVEPGAWVRLAGQDLSAGERVISSGQRVTPEHILAAVLAGIGSVAVRRSAVRLDWEDGPEHDWLAARLARCGARLAGAGGHANLVIRPTADDRPLIALSPGGTASVAGADGITRITLPPRFDALVGAWCALALPILARLAGVDLVSRTTTLAGKIASAVGWTELVLLRMDAEQAHPLAVGDAPLGRLLQANAFAILGPESEGAPAGAPIAVISLDRPF